MPDADTQLAILGRGAVDLSPRSDFVGRLKKSHASQTPLRVKVGFDPTAPDLHLGHAVLMEKMAQFQRLGHDLIFLIGDYTALIGDPTGRNALRPPLSPEQIRDNARTYTEQAFKILDQERTEVRYNSEWLASMTFADVIRLASRYNVGRMFERRDFRQRFEENRQISIHEFLYPLMQAYDSVALNCDVELGGQDQIFNLNAGRHIMEQYGLEPQCVLTVGLLIGLDGADKMSKSKGNHVGIAEAAEDMFGKVMSISDELMTDWYSKLLPSTPDTVRTDPLTAKKGLAEALVHRFHGEDVAKRVRQWWDAGRPVLASETVEARSGPLYQLVHSIGAAKSNGDARRKITQGGVSIDGHRHTDPNHSIPPGEFEVKVGKKFAVRCRVT
ncbi:MAG: tyrosine--tRNA ligase [Myxococcota bacterium]